MVKKIRSLSTSHRRLPVALFIIILLVVGGYFILHSRASGLNSSNEIESGSFSGGVKPAIDMSASGDANVQFGSPTNRSRLGVDINALPTGISLGAAYDEIASLGFGWVRTSPNICSYSNLNPDNFDYELSQAKRTNIKVMIVMTYAYCGLGSNGDHSAPKDPAAWAKYAGQLVHHWEQTYPGVVGAVEVWNEANNPAFWNPVSPEAYTDLLRRTTLEIKAVDRTMVIVASGTAPGGGNQAANKTSDPTNPATFYKRMYAAGAKDYFDAAANHPYDTSSSTANATQSGLRNTFWIRQVMNQNGDSFRQIWSTEAGLASCWTVSGGSTPMTETTRSSRLSADLQDFWYGTHDTTDGHTIGTSTTSDWNAGPYFYYKLYKAWYTKPTDGSDPGFGIVYNTKSVMSSSAESTSERLCKSPPSDYYEPDMARILRYVSSSSQ